MALKSSAVAVECKWMNERQTDAAFICEGRSPFINFLSHFDVSAWGGDQLVTHSRSKCSLFSWHGQSELGEVSEVEALRSEHVWDAICVRNDEMSDGGQSRFSHLTLDMNSFPVCLLYLIVRRSAARIPTAERIFTKARKQLQGNPVSTAAFGSSVRLFVSLFVTQLHVFWK